MHIPDQAFSVPNYFQMNRFMEASVYDELMILSTHIREKVAFFWILKIPVVQEEMEAERMRMQFS